VRLGLGTGRVVVAGDDLRRTAVEALVNLIENHEVGVLPPNLFLLVDPLSQLAAVVVGDLFDGKAYSTVEERSDTRYPGLVRQNNRRVV